MPHHLGPSDKHHPTRPRSIVADHPGAPHPHRLRRDEAQPDVIARLEWLDDLMFAAIDGDANSLQAASDAWRRTRDELGKDVVEESRQEYVRCATGVWHSLRVKPNHSPAKVFAAIEVISLLTGHAG